MKLSVCLAKKPAYFIIKLIFATIHEPTALFDTIHRFNILVNFYLYLQYFQQKVFSFSKINGSQTYPKYSTIQSRFYQTHFTDLK